MSGRPFAAFEIAEGSMREGWEHPYPRTKPPSPKCLGCGGWPCCNGLPLNCGPPAVRIPSNVAFLAPSECRGNPARRRWVQQRGSRWRGKASPYYCALSKPPLRPGVSFGSLSHSQNQHASTNVARGERYSGVLVPLCGVARGAVGILGTERTSKISQTPTLRKSGGRDCVLLAPSPLT